MTHDEVISSFLDNEPFDARELADALADPGGRDLLLDLIALRAVVQPEPAPVPALGRSPSRIRLVMAAAGLVLAVGVGYQWGVAGDASRSTPPEPTRVVVSEGPWQAQ